MSLQSFIEQRKEVTISRAGGSMIADFEKGRTQEMRQRSVTVRTIEPEKLTKWQWISKQLMKPVGMVAAETENIGLFIGGQKTQLPGKAALDVLTGTREYSFSDLPLWFGNIFS